MPNEENLIPNSERTPEERREIAQKGGIASGAARRRKRSLREAADLYLSLPVADKRQANKLLRRYVPDEDIDNQMAMIAGLHAAATQAAFAAHVARPVATARNAVAQRAAQQSQLTLAA